MKLPTRFLMAWAVAPLLAWGGPIDLAGAGQVLVPDGATITIEFGVWTYARHNSGSPYPTHLEFQARGMTPEGMPPALVPGSTEQYFPTIQFEGWLESLDGSLAMPLVDPKAAALGLESGQLVASLGSYQNGDAYPIQTAILEAWVDLTPVQSEALFGSNWSNYSDAARIRLHNLGEAFTLGIGGGYVLRNVIQEPGIRGILDGAEASGITGAVQMETPEPATWLLLGGALAGLGVLRLRR